MKRAVIALCMGLLFAGGALFAQGNSGVMGTVPFATSPGITNRIAGRLIYINKVPAIIFKRKIYFLQIPNYYEWIALNELQEGNFILAEGYLSTKFSSPRHYGLVVLRATIGNRLYTFSDLPPSDGVWVEPDFWGPEYYDEGYYPPPSGGIMGTRPGYPGSGGIMGTQPGGGIMGAQPRGGGTMGTQPGGGMMGAQPGSGGTMGTQPGGGMMGAQPGSGGTMGTQPGGGMMGSQPGSGGTMGTTPTQP